MRWWGRKRRDYHPLAPYLDMILSNTTLLVQQGEQQLAALDDLKAQVAATITIEASAITLIQGIAQQLKDAIAANDPAALTDLATQLGTSATALAAAVTANTPATP